MQFQHKFTRERAILSLLLLEFFPQMSKNILQENMRHWPVYGHVNDRKFTLRNDHQALKSLLSASGSGHCPLHIHIWLNRLFRYNFDIRARPGKLYQVADFCLVLSPTQRQEDQEDQPLEISNSPGFMVTPQDLVTAFQNDPVIQVPN